MAGSGILANIVSELLKNLGSKALEEIAAAWGFKGQLKKLKDSAIMIKAVLSDAEQRQEGNEAVRLWLERLRSIVYDADDLFDEFSTMATRKELMPGSTPSKHVRLFFSNSNQAVFAFKMARQVKKIRGKLDAIEKDGNQFAFRLQGNDGQALSLGTRETPSSVDAEEVIGRDEDRKAIVEMLMLDPAVGENFSVLSIVGMGGLGKTTLAQLVFNDDRIKNHFEPKLWVCVGDVFDTKVVIANILMYATGNKPEGVGIDQLQSQLHGVIGGKKYLLVLDDVWNENREKWLDLANELKAGSKGSKILVTTRSKKVAEKSGNPTPYELKGLSEEMSWSLFQRMAFEPGHSTDHLVEVGKEIVKKCANVPLAIKTLGCHLYGEEEGVWLSFRENELPKMPEGGDSIMAILKISYHHLPSALKNCFAYCCLFPKDYEMDKKTLIYLWMAEGFIIPSYEGQSLEDAGEMYFLTLLQRCFFQDITKDEWGDIKSCKMHDLMHDLAQEVAGTEAIVAKLGMTTFDEKAHHLSFDYQLSSESEFPASLFQLKSLRTFLMPEQHWRRMDERQFSKSICRQIFSSFRCLRVLELRSLTIEPLASSIGDLVHLRYLDLSSTDIKGLPPSITKLQNLQTLKLSSCYYLEILPMNIKNLINLRHLNVSHCIRLTCMPVGIGTLTNLHQLDAFLVGSKRSASNSRAMVARLRDLNALAGLRGKLHIEILGELRDPANEAREENLRSKCSGLTELHIEWKEDDEDKLDDEVSLDFLQLYDNLRKLKIERFRGPRLRICMDNWNSGLSNLVEVSLESFQWCRNVPSFYLLPSLKRLIFSYLESVEYMESSNYKPASSLFFPSLEELTLVGMFKLKGWWNMEVEAETSSGEKTTISSTTSSIEGWQQHKQLPSFPTLRRLKMVDCPKLKSMPLCPNVEELELSSVNRKLVVLTYSMASPIEYSTATSTTSSSFHEYASRLKTLTLSKKEKTLDTNCVDDILCQPVDFLQNLSSLTIKDRMIPDLSSLGKVFRSLSSLEKMAIYDCEQLDLSAECMEVDMPWKALKGGLRSLKLWGIPKMVVLPNGLQHLISLEKMEISNCYQLDLSAECMEVDMPWKALKGLRSLEFHNIPKMVVLPDGLRHLTTLRSLKISTISKLIALPEWMSCLTSLESLGISCCDEVKSLPEGLRLLTSLQHLRIVHCPGLTERCGGPNGDDWSKIQHIPSVEVDHYPVAGKKAWDSTAKQDI